MFILHGRGVNASEAAKSDPPPPADLSGMLPSGNLGPTQHCLEVSPTAPRKAPSSSMEMPNLAWFVDDVGLGKGNFKLQKQDANCKVQLPFVICAWTSRRVAICKVCSTVLERTICKLCLRVC